MRHEGVDFEILGIEPLKKLINKNFLKISPIKKQELQTQFY